MMTKADDFFKVKLPDYDRESSLVVQLCIVAAIVWLFILPTLGSRPVSGDTATTSSSSTPVPPSSSSVEASHSRPSSMGNKKGKKKTSKIASSPSQHTKKQANGQQDTQLQSSSSPPPPRYIPLWFNLLCIAGFCLCACGIIFYVSPYNYYTPRRVFQAPLLTPAECQHVVEMATRAAERNALVAAGGSANASDATTTTTTPQGLLEEPVGWQKTRHGTYPTTDLNLVTDPFTKEDRAWLSNILDRRLAPSVERFFGYPAASIRMNDLFVVRYDAGKRTRLANHTDDADVSFNILLTDDFEGGGTRFWNRYSQKPFAHVEPTTVGTFLTHGSQIHHEGYHVSKGTRMILVGFTSIDRFDPWSGQSTGLSWLASWLSLSWTLIRCKMGYVWSLSRHNKDLNETPGLYDSQMFRLLFRDVIGIFQYLGDRFSTHTVTTVVEPANATAYLAALDAEYQARGRYKPKANWFKGQNIDLEVDGTIAREWPTRIEHQSRFDEL